MMSLSAADTGPVLVSTIKDWLTTCRSCHTTCVNSQHEAIPNNEGLTGVGCWRPAWLIDVSDYCIVQGSLEGEYSSLSYTWEDDEQSPEERLQLLSHNIDSLKEVNSLKRHRHRLSKAIIDAIELTASIGTRYLWVDRLCIVQDDLHKATELMKMDRIYSGATLTIAAAAPSGLYLSSQDSIHNATVPALKMSGPAMFKTVRAYYQRVARSKWAKRAWTYQEYILSRRVVFFLGTVIFWQCDGAVWDSDQLMPYPHEINHPYTIDVSETSALTFLRHIQTPTWPDFGLYASLICPYNGRGLSHQEDGLSACFGILNRLEPAFPRGFIFGLPRMYLDHALLWQPLKSNYDSPDPPIKHPRKLSDGCEGRTGPSSRRPTLPSWAWCGWQCFIDPNSFRAAMEIDSQGTYKGDTSSTWRLKSTVEWKSINDMQTPAQQHRGSAPELSPSLSTQISYSPPNYIAAWTSCITLHAAATLELRIEPFMMKRAGFMDSSVNPVLSEKSLNEMCQVGVLQNATGRFAGLLRITDSGTSAMQGDMTLVAMSWGTANGKDLKNCFEEKVFRRSRYHNPKPFRAIYDDNERWIDCSPELSYKGKDNYRVLAVGDYNESLQLMTEDYDETQEYEFCNVLWIQRGENGVSYRAGCGRILKEDWEMNEPVEQRIILG
ncbi:heterokaryon incompatibility [Fusarium longipes]|uniref:Heterokaryon incompatibility n=1 Tax=Fusarium longipes TaxID=694270 RepID=A0A395S535_9HYPO|nr:heterokaryon incompatibility [Fusarium longipes]